MDVINLIKSLAEYTPGLLGWGVSAFLVLACWKQNKDNLDHQQKSVDSVSEVIKDNTQALVHLKILIEERTVKRSA